MNNFCVTSQTVQGTGMARIMNSHEMQMSYEIGYNYWGGVWSDIWLAGQYVAGNWLWSVGGGTSTTAMSYTNWHAWTKGFFSSSKSYTKSSNHRNLVNVFRQK